MGKKRRDQLAHLHPADVASQAHPRTRSKCEEETTHVRRCSLIQPAFGAEGLDVFAKDGSVAVYDPWVCSNGCLPKLELQRDVEGKN